MLTKFRNAHTLLLVALNLPLVGNATKLVPNAPNHN
jgi:hypothetical protein